jgi:hypothetical protein
MEMPTLGDAVLRLLSSAAQLEGATGLRVCLIGGLARDVWAEPRATQDVDVIVDSADASVVLAHAAALGLVFVEQEVAALKRSHMTRLRLPEEVTGKARIDVLARSHEYYGRILDRSIVAELLGVRIRVACAEDIIVLKTLADRPQDRTDVSAIVAAQGSLLRRQIVEQECAALEIDLPIDLR